jgi:hypothetical protein
MPTRKRRRDCENNKRAHDSGDGEVAHYNDGCGWEYVGLNEVLRSKTPRVLVLLNICFLMAVFAVFSRLVTREAAQVIANTCGPIAVE